MDDKLTPEMREINLKRMREYLETLAPSLRLSEPDSFAFKHYAEHGHVFRKGCCSRSRRDSTRGL